jgi:hypothetical protein
MWTAGLLVERCNDEASSVSDDELGNEPDLNAFQTALSQSNTNQTALSFMYYKRNHRIRYNPYSWKRRIWFYWFNSGPNRHGHMYYIIVFLS